MVPDSYLLASLYQLRDEFVVDVSEALVLSGEALARWLEQAEAKLFKELTSEGR